MRMYLSKQEFEKKMVLAQRKNASKLRKQLLRKEKMKYWPKIKLPSTSKLVLLVAALLCLEIVIFCQYVMLKTWDTSSLYAMIGVVTALASVVLGYFVKSKAENSAGGIVYESAMKEQSRKDNEEAVG